MVPMAYFDAETSRNAAFELGALLGCDAKTSERLLECLLTVKAEEMTSVQEKMRVSTLVVCFIANDRVFPLQLRPFQLWIATYPSNGAFRPTVEDAKHSGSFLTEVPIRASYRDTNVSMMIGMTSGDGGEVVARKRIITRPPSMNSI